VAALNRLSEGSTSRPAASVIATGPDGGRRGGSLVCTPAQITAVSANDCELGTEGAVMLAEWAVSTTLD
jgi:hypothetical protein